MGMCRQAADQYACLTYPASNNFSLFYLVIKPHLCVSKFNRFLISSPALKQTSKRSMCDFKLINDVIFLHG